MDQCPPYSTVEPNRTHVERQGIHNYQSIEVPTRTVRPVIQATAHIDTSIALCPHPHSVLVTSVVEEPGSPSHVCSLSMLHHWELAAARPTVFSIRRLDVQELRMVQGFRDLGTFQLPMQELQASETMSALHECLSILIADLSNDTTMQQPPQATDISNPDLVKYISESLKPYNISHDQVVEGILVRMFTITVFGNSPNALFEGGSTPLWKWAKPQSVYPRKTGVWEVDLADAITNGAWGAGKDLMLLVRGVPDEDRERFVDEKYVIF